ncbi:hypothetical protein Hypma_003996 [Hypsizygus marmoreus]|uniref:Anti-proliferative protein domain-containing protein n=1 Tax=Hypsizygus marmoreus TaxID=39966 RepID=A0A369J0Y0_HYPMA|nr:hypothetical protein Hypma_003996 [Hypsizygus marmoreus]
MSSTIDVTPAIHAATIFLIRPLVLLGTYPTETLLTLQTLLQAAFSTSSHNVLSLSPTALPPLPIYLACLKTDVSWTIWIRVLGGSAFDIFVEPERVFVVRKDTAEIGVVWVAPSAADITPASKNVARPTTEKQSPYAAAGQATSAVLEIDSDTESEISDSSDSRPSSRSSNHSGFSFSSRSSASSQSSFCSMANVPEPKPKPTTATTQPTKYMYQGGVSTVLTGGVMLGARSAAPRPALASTTNMARAAPPALRAPAYTPPHRAQRQPASSRGQKGGANSDAQTWRRGGVLHTVA